ncbi:MAG TPA: DUF1287 domain-containing protein [Pyrinomonadaceae bacterium]
MKWAYYIAALMLIPLVVFCGCNTRFRHSETASSSATATELSSPVIRTVVESGIEQTRTTRSYTQKYFVIPYPNGDVPAETGSCTDVVIRSFRSAGVDLQREVHEDMAANFSAYPKKWGLRKPDTNIDHRRVPNLQTFFKRRGKALPVTVNASDYQPGDVVSWDLDGRGMTHIGIVSNLWSEHSGRYLIIHNIGAGTTAEDRLFDWPITGHFRYFR